MKQAYDKNLGKPLRDILFEKLPNYVFWDIKVPKNNAYPARMNKYDNLKPYQFHTIFDYMIQADYFERRHKNPNLAENKKGVERPYF